LSRQIIWQEMKPLLKRFRDRPATGIGAEINGFCFFLVGGKSRRDRLNVDTTGIGAERFSLHPALKPFEMQFATAILAEK
jgi:hypothetical protein